MASLEDMKFLRQAATIYHHQDETALPGSNLPVYCGLLSYVEADPSDVPHAAVV